MKDDFDNWYVFDKRNILNDRTVFDTQRYYTILLALFDICVAAVVIPILSFSDGCPVWFKILHLGCMLFILHILKTEEVVAAYHIFKTLRKIPKWQKDNAKIAYGRLWRTAAIECYLCHYPGDCLICGAE
jgi:hypothetical protein